MKEVLILKTIFVVKGIKYFLLLLARRKIRLTMKKKTNKKNEETSTKLEKNSDLKVPLFRMVYSGFNKKTNSNFHKHFSSSKSNTR